MKIAWNKKENISFEIFRPAGECAFCEKLNVGEPNSFIVLSGGGLLRQRKLIGQSDNYALSEKVEGFLSLHWHGADLESGGVGDFPNTNASHEIATNDFEGQFEFYFCSVECLRRFLNNWVDELEQKIRNAVEEQSPTKD